MSFVLVLAGLAKLSDPRTTHQAITRLLPTRLVNTSGAPQTIAAAGLAVTEILVGLALLARPGDDAAATGFVAWVLCLGFVGVVGVARRRGAACGCFGSFSPGISGRAESARAASLALIAGTTTLIRFEAGGTPRPLAVAAGAGVSLTVTIGATWHQAGGMRPARLMRAALACRHRFSRLDGWRRARPWERRRVLKALRRHPAVIEVIGRTSWITWSWRRADVSVTTRQGRVASVVVPARTARLHVLSPEAGSPAVVGYTSKGVVVPRSR